MKTFPHVQDWILTGYSYQANGEAYLQVDDLGHKPSRRYHLPVRSQLLQISLLEVKYCIGSYDLVTQQQIPCPYHRQIQVKYTSCYNCGQVAAFNPAFYHVPIAQLSPQQQQYNLQAHVTYLAYFGEQHVKVGIARESRLLRRWLEQGARAAVVLQVADDAYQARALEEQVSRIYQIPERITIQQKKKLLPVAYSFQTAENKLSQYKRTIADHWALQDTDHVTQDLQGYYFPNEQPKYLMATKPGPVLVAGKCISMIGYIMIYESKGHFLMQSIKPFIGRASVQLTNFTSPPTPYFH